jgi:hypothetical protein
MGAQMTSNSQGNTEQKSNAGSITIPAFKLYYRAIAIKTAWHWHKNRHEDQWNRIEDQDMNPCSDVHLIFDKGPKIYNGIKTASSTNITGKTGYLRAENNPDPCLSPCRSVNSKWIKDLNIRPETLKQLLE